jgi:hypothetical protein
MRTYRGVEVWIRPFLPVVLHGGEWSASRKSPRYLLGRNVGGDKSRSAHCEEKSLPSAGNQIQIPQSSIMHPRRYTTELLGSVPSVRKQLKSKLANGKNFKPFPCLSLFLKPY